MASPSLDDIITEIDKWISDTIHNSVVSREVAVYNHVHAACQELKARMVTLVTGKPPVTPVPEPAAEQETAAPEAEPSAPPKAKPSA